MKHNWLFWIPRILVILFALFTMLFSFDVFGMQAPWYKIALGFIIHNVPFIVLMLLLWISWKHPSIGSISFFLVMIAFALIVRPFGHIMTLVYFMAPPFIMGVLFLFDYFQQKKYQDEMEEMQLVPEQRPIVPENVRYVVTEPEVKEPETVVVVEPAKPMEQEKPIEPIKPSEPVKPVEPAKPEEHELEDIELEEPKPVEPKPEEPKPEKPLEDDDPDNTKPVE